MPFQNPLLDDNPFLQRMMTDTVTAGLKRIGEAHLYLRGMQWPLSLRHWARTPTHVLVEG